MGAQNGRNSSSLQKDVSPLLLQGIHWRQWVTAASNQALPQQPWISSYIYWWKLRFPAGQHARACHHFPCSNIAAHWSNAVCAVSVGPVTIGLRLLQHIANKGQYYSSPIYGHSQSNHSAGVRPQSMALVWRNCSALRQRLENVVATGSSYID
jgi:hypothetical protein